MKYCIKDLIMSITCLDLDNFKIKFPAKNEKQFYYYRNCRFLSSFLLIFKIQQIQSFV